MSQYVGVRVRWGLGIISHRTRAITTLNLLQDKSEGIGDTELERVVSNSILLALKAEHWMLESGVVR